MNVLVLGSGGREHALAQALRKSKYCNQVFVSPGNDGIRESGFLTFGFDDFSELKEKVFHHQIKLIIPGGEAYLAKDIAKYHFGSDVKVFGPTAELSQLETSKAWAKKLMTQAGIPTASFFPTESVIEALQCLDSQDWREGVVIKSDGLASGKGVVVCASSDEARLAVNELSSLYGEKFVLEEKLRGPEFSAFCIVHNNEFIEFGSACDYKKRSSDVGSPNTGGMGAYAPCFWADQSEVRRLVWEPLFSQIKEQGLSYTGFLYVGLMLTSEGLKVIEFNVRLGDPEAQALLPLLESDLCSHILGVDQEVKFDSQKSSVHVVLVHPDYPKGGKKSFKLDLPLSLKSETVEPYFSSLQKKNDGWFVPGGRVLGFTAVGESLVRARTDVYEHISQVLRGNTSLSFREDIGL